MVGGLGKGGKGYFCLDLSAIISQKVEDNTGSIVKWEHPNANLSAINSDNGNSEPLVRTNGLMGYSFSKAYLVRIE